jgi:hemerythrin-like domain-containing protein
MNAFDNLVEDHRQILRALDAIDARARQAGGALDLAFFERALDFIRTFADGLHYQKEEEGLFRLLQDRGMPKLGPIQFLEMEHEATRAQTERIAGALTALRGGDATAKGDLLDAVARFSAVVRVHIPKENLCFFPMAQMFLVGNGLEELERKFAALEAGAARSIQDAAGELEGFSAPVLPSPPPPPVPGLELIVKGLSRPLAPGLGMPARITRRSR